jgi:hypothetical protein
MLHVSRAFARAAEDQLQFAPARRKRPMSEPWRCKHCGDVIGVYEPITMIEDHEARETSRAAQSDLPPHGEYYHRACYGRRAESDSGSAPAG